MGVEPTRRTSRSVHAGFEDQGGHRTPCASVPDSTRGTFGRSAYDPSVKRVLFVEAKDRAILAAFARGLKVPWRLLARPAQGFWLLELTDAAEEVERVAAVLPGVRAWSFDVIDESRGG